MHAASEERSERLQRMLRVLQAHPHGATTFELQTLTGSMAPATDLSELRANGCIIERRCEGKTTSGRWINRYFYRGRKEI